MSFFSKLFFGTGQHSMRRVHETVRCLSVCLSVRLTQHWPTAAAAGLLLRVRRAEYIDRLLHGRRAAEVVCRDVISQRPGMLNYRLYSEVFNLSSYLLLQFTKGTHSLLVDIAECKEQEPCGIRCDWGLQYDSNGCQLCQCAENPCNVRSDYCA